MASFLDDMFMSKTTPFPEELPHQLKTQNIKVPNITPTEPPKHPIISPQATHEMVNPTKQLTDIISRVVERVKDDRTLPLEQKNEIAKKLESLLQPLQSMSQIVPKAEGVSAEATPEVIPKVDNIPQEGKPQVTPKAEGVSAEATPEVIPKVDNIPHIPDSSIIEKVESFNNWMKSAAELEEFVSVYGDRSSPVVQKYLKERVDASQQYQEVVEEVISKIENIPTIPGVLKVNKFDNTPTVPSSEKETRVQDNRRVDPKIQNVTRRSQLARTDTNYNPVLDTSDKHDASESSVTPIVRTNKDVTLPTPDTITGTPGREGLSYKEDSKPTIAERYVGDGTWDGLMNSKVGTDLMNSDIVAPFMHGYKQVEELFSDPNELEELGNVALDEVYSQLKGWVMSKVQGLVTDLLGTAPPPMDWFMYIRNPVRLSLPMLMWVVKTFVPRIVKWIAKKKAGEALLIPGDLKDVTFFLGAKNLTQPLMIKKLIKIETRRKFNVFQEELYSQRKEKLTKDLLFFDIESNSKHKNQPLLSIQQVTKDSSWSFKIANSLDETTGMPKGSKTLSSWSEIKSKIFLPTETKDSHLKDLPSTGYKQFVSMGIVDESLGQINDYMFDLDLQHGWDISIDNEVENSKAPKNPFVTGWFPVTGYELTYVNFRHEEINSNLGVAIQIPVGIDNFCRSITTTVVETSLKTVQRYLELYASNITKNGLMLPYKQCCSRLTLWLYDPKPAFVSDTEKIVVTTKKVFYVKPRIDLKSSGQTLPSANTLTIEWDIYGEETVGTGLYIIGAKQNIFNGGA